MIIAFTHFLHCFAVLFCHAEGMLICMGDTFHMGVPRPCRHCSLPQDLADIALCLFISCSQDTAKLSVLEVPH